MNTCFQGASGSLRCSGENESNLEMYSSGILQGAMILKEAFGELTWNVPVIT